MGSNRLASHMHIEDEDSLQPTSGVPADEPSELLRRFEHALRTERAEEGLRAVARRALSETGDRASVVAALEQLRARNIVLRNSSIDDSILNVLDALTGWGPTGRRL